MIAQFLLTVLAGGSTPPPVGDDFLSLAELKAHLRVDHDYDDVLIQSTAGAALAYIERLTGLVFAPRDEAFLFDCFGPALLLPLRPVDAGSIVLTYVDPEGVSQSFASIRTIVKNGFVRIMPAIGSRWPVPARAEGAIVVTATVGSTTADDDIRMAAKLLVGHWYENREAVIVGTIADRTKIAVDELLQHHRSFRFQ
jgi:uncharacterized phiE125 gp8 family phage protein